MTYLKENYKQTILFLGIFVLLLLSSPMFRNNETTTLFLIFGYGLRTLAFVLPIYFYYKKQFNEYICFVLLMSFYNDIYIHLILIIVSIILFNKKLLPELKTPYIFIYLLFALSVVSYIINQFIELDLLSYPIFMVTFLLPTVFYGVGYNLADNIDLKKIIVFFNSIVMALYAVIYLQIFIYGINDPDILTGGTAHPHFAAVFISISFLISVFAHKTPDLQDDKWKRLIIILLYLPTMYFIDAKYILLWVIVSIFFVSVYFILTKNIYRIGLTVIVAFSLVLLSRTNFNLPISHVAVKYKDFGISDLERRFKTTQKYEMLKNLVSLPKNDLNVFLIGAGPGTFLSQAGNFRMPKKENESFATLGGQNIKVSKFFNSKISWVKTKYGQFFLEHQQSSSAFSDWRSSYINLVFELGIIGLGLYLLFYIMNIKIAFISRLKENKKQLSILLAALGIFFLLMPLMELWAEYHNYLIVSMTYLGLLNGKLIKNVI